MVFIFNQSLIKIQNSNFWSIYFCIILTGNHTFVWTMFSLWFLSASTTCRGCTCCSAFACSTRMSRAINVPVRPTPALKKPYLQYSNAFQNNIKWTNIIGLAQRVSSCVWGKRFHRLSAVFHLLSHLIAKLETRCCFYQIVICLYQKHTLYLQWTRIGALLWELFVSTVHQKLTRLHELWGTSLSDQALKWYCCIWRQWSFPTLLT